MSACQCLSTARCFPCPPSPPPPSHQRWASTLANMSNARYRSNIRAPPRPLPPDLCIQSVGICVARGAGSDSWLAEVSGCHIFVPAPHAPPPKGRGQRSKVVILPTTASHLHPLQISSANFRRANMSGRKICRQSATHSSQEGHGSGVILTRSKKKGIN
jgi:hypothetical protein